MRIEDWRPSPWLLPRMALSVLLVGISLTLAEVSLHRHWWLAAALNVISLGANLAALPSCARRGCGVTEANKRSLRYYTLQFVCMTMGGLNLAEAVVMDVPRQRWFWLAFHVFFAAFFWSESFGLFKHRIAILARDRRLIASYQALRHDLDRERLRNKPK